MDKTANYKIADGGKREDQGTGAMRDTRAGKGRYDLLSPVAQRRLAKHTEAGAIKYSDRNWEKGMAFSRFLDSAKRHINDYEMLALYKREGRSLTTLPSDVDAREDHLAAAVWNLAAVMHFEDIAPEFDDLSKKEESVLSNEQYLYNKAMDYVERPFIPGDQEYLKTQRESQERLLHGMQNINLSSINVQGQHPPTDDQCSPPYEKPKEPIAERVNRLLQFIKKS